jgi:cell division protein FtsL
VKVDNSQIVREVDPRSFRDLVSQLVLVAVLVVGLVLYAWPHLQVRQTSVQTERMNREKERLIEQNRKLRLERATLQNLHRVETIATRELGMSTPPPEKVIVVARPEAVPDAARVASADAPRAKKAEQ